MQYVTKMPNIISFLHKQLEGTNLTELTYNIIPLWTCGYWDGPLSGLCIYEQQICFFEISNSELADERLYDIYEISPEDIIEEIRAHSLFEEYVGTHCNYYYDEDKKRFRRNIGAQVNDPNKSKLYWEKYPPGSKKPKYLRTILKDVTINF